VLRVREGNSWKAIALSGGFAEVDADEVTVLVNAAELGSNIDTATAEKAFEAAQQLFNGFEGKPSSPGRWPGISRP